MIFLLPSSLAHLEGRQRTHTAKPATAAHCVLKDSRVNFEKTISPIHRLAATWPLSVGLEKLVMKSVFPDRESKFQTRIFFFLNDSQFSVVVYQHLPLDTDFHGFYFLSPPIRYQIRFLLRAKAALINTSPCGRALRNERRERAV